MADSKRYRIGGGKGVLAAREGGSAAVEEIRRGFPWKRVHEFQTAYGLNDERFARLVGVSERTLARHRRGTKALDPVASDRLYRAEQAMRAAEIVFGDKATAVAWMSEPHYGLKGQVPMTMLDTEPGARAVLLLLGQLDNGVIP